MDLTPKTSSKDEGVQAYISIIQPRNLDNVEHKCNFNIICLHETWSDAYTQHVTDNWIETHNHKQFGPKASLGKWKYKWSAVEGKGCVNH